MKEKLRLHSVTHATLCFEQLENGELDQASTGLIDLLQKLPSAASYQLSAVRQESSETQVELKTCTASRVRDRGAEFLVLHLVTAADMTSSKAEIVIPKARWATNPASPRPHFYFSFAKRGTGRGMVLTLRQSGKRSLNVNDIERNCIHQLLAHCLTFGEAGERLLSSEEEDASSPEKVLVSAS